MALRYMSDLVKLLLTLKVLLMFVISTASTRQCTSTNTEKDGYVIKNIGIKLCQLKCAEHGQCVSIEYDIETLTCRLLRGESKIKKEEGNANLPRSHSHVPTGSCICSFGQRCLKTQSGKEVCVQASMTDASANLTPSNMVPPAPVTTQDCDPLATPSHAKDADLFSASEEGDLGRVKLILKKRDVDINTRVAFCMTPVMVAAFNGRRNVVEFLVGRGADVSLVDHSGNTVLHLACRGAGDLAIVKLILSLNKVDINARNIHGVTAADWLRLRGEKHLLESHGSNQC